jgi:hypothetical protein
MEQYRIGVASDHPHFGDADGREAWLQYRVLSDGSTEIDVREFAMFVSVRELVERGQST